MREEHEDARARHPATLAGGIQISLSTVLDVGFDTPIETAAEHIRAYREDLAEDAECWRFGSAWSIRV